MITGEFTFDLSRARQPQGTLQYLPAYPVTNEPIKNWLSLTPTPHAPRVLSVTASGDQPLMYAAHGAAHVDTFDLTINACAVMDFKTTALQMNIKHTKYQEIVRTLGTLSYHRDNLSRQFHAIVNNMPDRTRELMRNNIIYRPYATCRDVLHDPIYPYTQGEYKKLQRVVTKPFNFIWANLMDVTMYINDQYDIIYLSNILDHYLHQQQLQNTQTIIRTICNLWPYLSDGGYIICTSGKTKIQHISYIMRLLLKILPINAHIQPLTYKRPIGWQPIIIQKTR